MQASVSKLEVSLLLSHALKVEAHLLGCRRSEVSQAEAEIPDDLKECEERCESQTQNCDSMTIQERQTGFFLASFTEQFCPCGWDPEGPY